MKSLERSIFAGLMVITSLVIITGNIIWTQDNYSARGDDKGSHLTASIEMFYLAQDIAADANAPLVPKIVALSKLIVADLPHIPPQFPNFVYFVTTAFYFLLGKSLAVAKLSNLLFLALLVGSVYVLGKGLGGRLAGLLSVLITLSCPIIYESFRQYGLDFPLTAMATLTFALLMKSDSFKNTYYSILAGISLGAGTLVKLQILIFLGFPLLILFFGIFNLKQPNRRLLMIRLINAALFLTIVAAISALWWGEHLSPVLQSGSAMRIEQYNLFRELFVSLKNMVFYSAGFPLLAVMAAGIALFCKSGAKNKYVYLVFAFAPMLVIPLMTFPLMRYTMPVFPVLSMMAAAGILEIRKPLIRIATLIFLLSYVLTRYYLMSFVPALNEGAANYDYAHNLKDITILGGRTSFRGGIEKLDKYNIKALVDLIGSSKADKTVVLVNIADPQLDSFLLRYRIRDLDRRIDPLDVVVSPRAIDAVGTAGFIVFIVPADSADKTGSFEYPGGIEFREKMSSIYDSWVAEDFKKTATWDLLTNKLISVRQYMHKIAAIECEQGYRYIVYERLSKDIVK